MLPLVSPPFPPLFVDPPLRARLLVPRFAVVRLAVPDFAVLVLVLAVERLAVERLAVERDDFAAPLARLAPAFALPDELLADAPLLEEPLDEAG